MVNGTSLGRSKLALVMGVVLLVGMTPVATSQDDAGEPPEDLTASICGQVYQGFSGEDQGLNATVFLDGLDDVNNHTLTWDQDGWYCFGDVPVGEYDVLAIPLVHLPGERTATLEPELNEDGEWVLEDLKTHHIGATTWSPI